MSAKNKRRRSNICECSKGIDDIQIAMMYYDSGKKRTPRSLFFACRIGRRLKGSKHHRADGSIRINLRVLPAFVMDAIAERFRRAVVLDIEDLGLIEHLAMEAEGFFVYGVILPRQDATASRHGLQSEKMIPKM